VIIQGKGPASKGYDVDALATQFARLGKMARDMPRSFDSNGITYAVDSPSGGPNSLGHLLPGRGFLPRVDLSTLGLHRRPRYVLDPSAFRRRMDRVEEKTRKERDWDRLLEGRGLKVVEGGAISTYDGIIASRGAGKAEDRTFTKSSITTVATTWSTLVHAGGQPPALTYLATTAPTDALLDRTNAAAISQYLTSPTSPDKKYLLTFGFGSAQQINIAVLVDILNHSGSYRMTVSTAETVVTPTLATRQYGPGTGIGNLVTLVVATAATFAVGTLTLQTVDQAGANTNAPALTTSATATTADTLVPSTAAVSGTGTGSFFIPLASGQTGVQAIKQNTLSVNTGTGGPLAGLVFFPLSVVPGVGANAYIERDSTTQIDGITELVQASSVIGFLSLIVQTNTTSSGALTGFIRTVAG